MKDNQMEFNFDSMIGYKLFRKMKNGDLKPLFIHASKVIPLNEWIKADKSLTPEQLKKMGFAHRPGFHCCLYPYAPHLKQSDCKINNRVWCRIEISGHFTEYSRPTNQGGSWILADNIKVLEELTYSEVDQINELRTN